jgi:hypothetical protein
MLQRTHLVLYHKQRSSARLRFLRHAHGGICVSPLPADALVQPGPCGANGGTVHQHPGMLLRDAEAALAQPRGCIESDAGFRCRLLMDDGCADLQLAQFCTIDPPLEEAAAVGARFIELTQARGLAPAELQVLRLVYEYVLG